MQRIFPRPQTSSFLRKGELLIIPSISELGVYGVYIQEGAASEPRLNEYAGYLLRTKPSDEDEGGVATGYSILNSPMFIDST
jgi:glutathione synthase